MLLAETNSHVCTLTLCIIKKLKRSSTQEVCSCGAADELAALQKKIKCLERDLEEAQHNSSKELCFCCLHHCLCSVHSNVQCCMGKYVLLLRMVVWWLRRLLSTKTWLLHV